jgi:LAO/AO transport system kinase
VVVEAAGYDVVLVETVGVGQSEITVAEMVDSFLFLTIARTGDQLQGIKRGILEIADVIAVNKADGAAAGDARKAARELAGAIRMLRGHPDDGWDVPVLTCAGLTGEGLDEVWAKLVEHQDRMKSSGRFEERRRTQQVRWTWQLVRDSLEHQLRAHPGVRFAVPDLEQAVLAGDLTPALAAQQILQTFLSGVDLSHPITP